MYTVLLVCTCSLYNLIIFVLHGEMTSVVIFYCGDDCLNEFEKNEKIPVMQKLRKVHEQDNIIHLADHSSIHLVIN